MPSKKPTLMVERVPIGSLTMDPENARKHSARNIDAIAGSLREFGQRRPLVVWGDVIIAGNGTVEAAKSLGWDEIDVTRVPADWSHEQARAYALADNRTAELAEWDGPELLSALEALDEELLAAAGFSQDDLDDLEKIWGTPPDLDDLGDTFTNADVDEGLVRISFRVDPDIAAMWNTILKATGLSDSDAAVEVMIRAAYDGLDINGNA